MKIRIIIGCEVSGVVRKAFRKQGFDAWSCDLEPSDDGSKYHIQDDIRNVLDRDWQLGIFHPPCTRLANSGVFRLRDNKKWEELKEAAQLFLDCYNAPIRFIAVENPIMNPYAKELIGVQQSFSIQPWQFGHGETKHTCIWSKNLPKLRSTKIMKGREQRIYNMSPSEKRAKARSETLPGVADAMAIQWGSFIKRYYERN